LRESRVMLRSASPQPVHRHFRKRRSLALARHFGRFLHDRISGGPPEPTTAFDWMTSAISRFQPGTFPPGPRLRRRIPPRSDGRRKVSSAEASFFQTVRIATTWLSHRSSF
jgi:hypothetical protein